MTRRARIHLHFHQTGAAYLAVLFLVVSISISMLVVTQNMDTLIKREKERDWLFIGQQYQRAIGQYYKQSPNDLNELPVSINSLIKDERYVSTARYLRQAYKDPLTGQEWLQIKDENGRLIGVQSASLQPIFSRQLLSTIAMDGENIQSHSDVKFIYKINKKDTEEKATE